MMEITPIFSIGKHLLKAILVFLMGGSPQNAPRATEKPVREPVSTLAQRSMLFAGLVSQSYRHATHGYFVGLDTGIKSQYETLFNNYRLGNITLSEVKKQLEKNTSLESLPNGIGLLLIDRDGKVLLDRTKLDMQSVKAIVDAAIENASVDRGSYSTLNLKGKMPRTNIVIASYKYASEIISIAIFTPDSISTVMDTYTFIKFITDRSTADKELMMLIDPSGKAISIPFFNGSDMSNEDFYIQMKKQKNGVIKQDGAMLYFQRIPELDSISVIFVPMK